MGLLSKLKHALSSASTANTPHWLDREYVEAVMKDEERVVAQLRKRGLVTKVPSFDNNLYTPEQASKQRLDGIYGFDERPSFPLEAVLKPVFRVDHDAPINQRVARAAFNRVMMYDAGKMSAESLDRHRGADKRREAGERMFPWEGEQRLWDRYEEGIVEIVGLFGDPFSGKVIYESKLFTREIPDDERLSMGRKEGQDRIVQEVCDQMAPEGYVPANFSQLVGFTTENRFAVYYGSIVALGDVGQSSTYFDAKEHDYQHVSFEENQVSFASGQIGERSLRYNNLGRILGPDSVMFLGVREVSPSQNIPMSRSPYHLLSDSVVPE